MSKERCTYFLFKTTTRKKTQKELRLIQCSIDRISLYKLFGIFGIYHIYEREETRESKIGNNPTIQNWQRPDFG